MHAMPPRPVAPARRIVPAGPHAYVVPARDGQAACVVVIDGDTMIAQRSLPPDHVFPRDADRALRDLGFRRTSPWQSRGARGGHRCQVASTTRRSA